MMEYVMEILLPFLATFAFTWLVGFERQNIGKSAGISAHVMISMAACGIAIMQVQLFDDFGHSDQRVIAQVITGIGFLGAGVILKSNRNVKGLTTATTIWACAMLGLILGMGYWQIGLTLGTFIVLFMYTRDIVRHCNPFVPHRVENQTETEHENDH